MKFYIRNETIRPNITIYTIGVTIHEEMQMPRCSMHGGACYNAQFATTLHQLLQSTR